MTDFEKRARDAAEKWAFENTLSTTRSSRVAVPAYLAGLMEGNADREAYAAERVREEWERILELLRSEEARRYYITRPEHCAHWLEARLKAEAGKETK